MQRARVLAPAIATLLLCLLPSCAPRQPTAALADFALYGNARETNRERVRVLDLYPGVTATVVAPAALDERRRVDLIIYALPNGNSTAETMGRRLADGVGWRYDIQHIGAGTRALRTLGMPQAVVAYMEADNKSWPEWRRTRGYDKANARIVAMVDQIRASIGNPPHLSVTLAGHSGGGSFIWGFIEGQPALPEWLERIALLDANYSFESRHGDRIGAWLRRSANNALVVLAYDDREIMLDGRKVVSDSGGTWRATGRMIEYFKPSFPFAVDTVGDFLRYRSAGMELLLHPNPANRILHTEMIGEMNGYMHAMLVRKPAYERGASLLKRTRAYTKWVDDGATLPPPSPPQMPARDRRALTGSAFIATIAGLVRDEREAAIRRELFAGNVPSFLRTLQRVTVTASGADSTKRTVVYEVMPDYLAIGSDEDFVRIPMSPHTAQAYCDAFGFVLPTRKMANDIWAAATVRVDPRPLVQEREASLTFLQHHRIIEGQLQGSPRGALVAGIKKDVVVTNRLQERPDRVAIFGWHYLTGAPIQPLYTGHVDWYVDYSHGMRPVRRTMLVDGRPIPFEAIVNHPNMHTLLSDEGVIAVPRYEKQGS